MAWAPPPPPLAYAESRIAYWRAIMDIPDTEPAAPLLRSMATHRLLELGALSKAEIRRLQSPLQDSRH